MVLHVKWESESDFKIFPPIERAPAGSNDVRSHVPFCCNTSHELTAGWNSCVCWIIGSVFNKQSYRRCRPGLIHTALSPPLLGNGLPLQACPNFLRWCDIPLHWTEPGHFLPSGRIALGHAEHQFWGFAVCLSNHIRCRNRKAGLPHGVSSLIFFYFLVFFFFLWAWQCGLGTQECHEVKDVLPGRWATRVDLLVIGGGRGDLW